MYQETYHLYHHQPEPLNVAAISDETWLLNNGVNYSVVATIKAPSLEKAYEGLLAKMEDHSMRSVEIRMGNIMRPTLPGDVLVGAKKAWMLLPDGQLHLLPYEQTLSWRSYAHDAAVRSLSWAPDGNHVAACGSNVILHDLHNDNELRHSALAYRRHGNHTVLAVAWSPDSKHIASGGYDAEVHIWRPRCEGSYLEASLGSIVICRTEESSSNYDREITCLTWAHDSCTLLAGRSDGCIVQWDAVTGTYLQMIHRHQNDVTALAHAPDGTRIASTSEDGTLRIWSIEDDTQEVICQHSGKIPSFAWSPDGSLLVSVSQGEQSLQFWDARSGLPSERIPLSIYSTDLLSIEGVAWSPDGRFIAAACDDGTLQIVDLRLRRQTQTYRALRSQFYGVAWSPNGQYLAAGERNYNGVRIWRRV